MKKIVTQYKSQIRLPIIILIIILAAFINAFSVKIFMKPLGLVPVGITGTSVLISQLSEKFIGFKFEYYYLYIFLNSMLSIWAWFFLSKRVVYKSILYIIIFFITSKYVPTYHLSDNKILNFISGGLCNGLSNVMLLFIGGSTAGYNFIGLYISKKAKKSLVGVLNLWTNGIMIGIATLIFGFEKGIMSLLTSMINSTIIDKYHNQSNFVSLFIVTNKPNLFTEYATEKLKRSSTIINSKGSYTQHDNSTIILTVSKTHFNAIKKDLLLIDPQAHITIFNVNQILGNMKSQVGKSTI